MLKRKLRAAIIAATLLAGSAIVPTFAQEPSQNGQAQEQGDKMKDDRMKDDKMAGDKMESKKGKHKKSKKHKAGDKMQGSKNQ